jgi:pyrophosphate--fructose-6-phosphate 1-phosphotransferase
MGRSASHITLECGLQSQPNITIISEEVEAKNLTLSDVVDEIVNVIVHRADHGMNFGTILIPEGLIEFIPAMKKLISELNDLLAHNDDFNALETDDEKRQYVKGLLSPDSAKVYRDLPKGIARQLTLDRDPHGNVQVSLIETEKLLIEMVAKRLATLKASGVYKGKFASINHFFGYEGRCAIPSNFDADYTYSLGYTAAVLISENRTGYMASVRNLTSPATEWIAGGVPITMMMNMERRHGKMKPVIQKALVKLDGAPFKYFAANRAAWADESLSYVYPGPIQYYGPSEVCDLPTRTLLLEKE